ncbi:MAG TPA: response regulator [Thermoanaerobaculia bacterium]|nr:response regulator [Thermoanaerobaculia bacterium]
MKPLALVIENDAGTRKLLDVLLSRLGLEVDLVPTGNDAGVVLQHVEYDVLLVDLLLPGKSGTQLLEELAAGRPHMLSRAVVISSASPVQLEALRERWPAVRTIRKPFELGEVIEATQQITAARVPRSLTAEEKFCRHSMRAGAKAGIIVRANGGVLEPLLSFGYTPEMVDSYFPLAVDAPYPLCKAVRHGKPMWIASVIAVAPEYPTLAPVWERNESRAVATVPLREGSRIVGAAGWSFREPRLFSEVEQQVLTGIAEAIPEWLRDEQSAASASA